MIPLELQFETHIKARLVCLRLSSNIASVPRRALNQTDKLEIHDEGKPHNSHIEIQPAKTIQACIKHDLLHIVCDHSFSIKKIGQYFRTCKPLSAQDADGWPGREHVGWLFADGDSTLQELLCTHLILPNILGDFLADHLDEIAGGHQEITRVILCRLILNDIIIHMNFFNDIILFYKIV